MARLELTLTGDLGATVEGGARFSANDFLLAQVVS